jgi:peptide/nickel transport system substrate-binding protein
MYLYKSGAYFNGHNYSNPTIDELADAANAASNRDDSADMYCQINNILWEDAPIIFLHTQAYTVAHKSSITGITGSADEKFSAIYAHPVD